MRYDLHVHTLTSTITLKYQTNILVSNTKYADNSATFIPGVGEGKLYYSKVTFCSVPRQFLFNHKMRNKDHKCDLVPQNQSDVAYHSLSV